MYKVEQITFIKRSSEIVILYDPNIEQENIQEKCKEKIQETNLESQLLAKIDDILKGSIPDGYAPCYIQPVQWKVKNGVILESNLQIVGDGEVITVYKVNNVSRKKIILREDELQMQRCRWVFLNTNELLSKQTTIALISVCRDDQ